MTEVAKIFDEFEKRLPELELSIDGLKQEFSKYDGIVLYGAGSSGIALLLALQRSGLQPLCFADGSKAKHHTVCMGLDVLPPPELTDKFGGNILVIVCINTDGRMYCRSFAEELRAGGHSGVHKSLHDAGCKNVIDYIALRRCFRLFEGDNTGNLPSCPDVFMMREHRGEIENIYERLCDKISRETYLRILSFRLLGECEEVDTFPQNEQYFPEDVFTLSDEEHFVDCGAFCGLIGQTVLDKTGGNIGAYYGLEPDSENYKRLEQWASGQPGTIRGKLTLSRCAAWDDDKGMSLYALNGPGSFAAEYGNSRVPTATIDGLLDGRPVTSIKMNIEGSELKALAGAEKSVRNFQPKLMISGYHKTWDFWEVPQVMLNFEPDHRLFLRSYMHHLSFVFYGI